MNLSAARRIFEEMRAAYAAKPAPTDDLVFRAQVETYEPGPVELDRTLAGLEALPTGPVVVTHPKDRTRSWTISAADAQFWIDGGHIVTLPQRKNGSAA